MSENKVHSEVGVRKEDVELVIQAIEESKPPSRFREALVYFMFGFAGGVGLGVLISFIR
ncbi:MAG: hypothetical protein N3G79_06940 [Sulfolobales archaeon]|nr:hypothetical protein [Sulfolobales archaeon]